MTICHYGGRTVVTCKIEMYLMNLLDLAKEILGRKIKIPSGVFDST